jgi:predicted metallopeptidase
MEIIALDEQVEELLINRIYQKPIFKIIYTMIFCLSKRHSQTFDEDIKILLHELVNIPFTYLLHKENKKPEQTKY